MRWIGWVVALVACSSSGSRLDPLLHGSAAQEPLRVDFAPALRPRPQPPLDVPPPTDAIVSFGRGASHACVVRASGAVDCWGQHRTCESRCDPAPPPDPTIRRAAGVTDGKAISGDARCVIRRGGELACLSNRALAFEPVAGVAKAIAMDDSATCVIVEGGGVLCSDLEGRYHRAAGIDDAVSIASAMGFACAVRRGGQVACGFHDKPFRPVRGLAGVRQIVLGSSYADVTACALTDRGTTCIELAPFADAPLAPRAVVEHALQDPAAFANATQLSLEWSTDEWKPVKRLEALVEGKIVTIDLAYGAKEHGVVPALGDAVALVHGCALRATGTLACWGDNTGGVLAQPTTIGVRRNQATLVPGLEDVVDLAAGDSHVFALTRNGRAFGWGGDRRVTMATPASIDVPVGSVEVAALVDRPCFRTGQGLVRCGELELDTERVVAIATESRGLHALRDDGSVEWHPLGHREEDGAPIVSLDVPALRGARVRARRCV